MNTNQPRQHQNKKVSELRAQADPLVVSKSRKSILLAAKIEDALIKKGVNKSSFAELMGVQPSVVTKWLSGKHNFTVETLFDIEYKLGISLIQIDDKKREIVLRYELVICSDDEVNIPSSYKPWKQIDYSHLSLQEPHILYNRQIEKKYS